MYGSCPAQLLPLLTPFNGESLADKSNFYAPKVENLPKEGPNYLTLRIA